MFPNIFCSRLMPLATSVRHTSNQAWISKIKRQTYTRTYPTILVFPDGSTVNIRYHEPVSIIKLPFDIRTLSEEERKLRLMKRKPKVIRKIQEDYDDGFSVEEYSHLWN
ncbi:MRPL55 (predicted) [Pycnogonum litorale]